jgi:hypothetical protein
MGGVMVTPRVEDFEKVTMDDVVEIFNEVCLSEKELKSMTTKLLH